MGVAKRIMRLMERSCTTQLALDVMVKQGGGQSPAGVQPRDLSDPAWQKTVRDEELRDLFREGADARIR